MSGRRVVLTSETSAHAPARVRRLKEAGFLLDQRYDIGPAASEDELVSALSGAWGVIAGAERYSRNVLERLAPSLRVIGRPGAGYDAIDLAAATDTSVVVLTTPGVNRHAVADFAVALMLASLRQVVALDAEVRSGNWRAAAPGRDLHGSTVGIVGLGAVGRTVARRLLGFECRVLGCDPFAEDMPMSALGVEMTTLRELLVAANVVTLHVALTDQTRHLLAAEQFRTMRRDSVLVNTSRGPIVDEAALIEALRSGRIAGAALDVFEAEPLPEGHPLAELSNVVLSSHVASHTQRSLDAMVSEVVDGLLDLAGGGAPAGALNPEVLVELPVSAGPGG